MRHLVLIRSALLFLFAPTLAMAQVEAVPTAVEETEPPLDWDLTEGPDRKLRFATAQLNVGLTLATRCTDGSTSTSN